MKNFTIFLTIILLCSLKCNAQVPLKSAQPQLHYKERDYQESWCKKNSGTMEYVLPDRARVDCVTDSHAIEFDFAKKWGESIGQALYYGMSLNKSPGIVLILENPAKDERYFKRVDVVAKKFGITVWTITPQDI